MGVCGPAYALQLGADIRRRPPTACSGPHIHHSHAGRGGPVLSLAHPIRGTGHAGQDGQARTAQGSDRRHAVLDCSGRTHTLDTVNFYPVSCLRISQSGVTPAAVELLCHGGQLPLELQEVNHGLHAAQRIHTSSTSC